MYIMISVLTIVITGVLGPISIISVITNIRFNSQIKRLKKENTSLEEELILLSLHPMIPTG